MDDALFKSTVYTWMMVLRVQEKSVRLKSCRKDLHRCQHCGKDSAPRLDLLGEREAGKDEKSETWYIMAEECQEVYVYLCVCVCVVQKHPWHLTGLVCLSVGKANIVRPPAAEDTASMSRRTESPTASGHRTRNNKFNGFICRFPHVGTSFSTLRIGSQCLCRSFLCFCKCCWHLKLCTLNH